MIKQWLPSLADKDTTRKWVVEALTKTGVTDASKMGMVMGALMKEHKAELDGKLTQTVVKEEIARTKKEKIETVFVLMMREGETCFTKKKKAYSDPGLIIIKLLK